MPFTLKDIKNKTLDKEDLFNNYENVKTIYDLKKHLNVKTANEAYQIAIDNMNKIISDLEKMLKEREETKKAKKKENVIKRALKKLKEQEGEFSVNISVVINIHWKVSEKQYQINDDFFQQFKTTKSQLPTKISDFLNGLFPMEDEYKIETLVSYEFQILENKPNVDKLDIPMKKATPIKLSFLKYFEKINPISYDDHNDECVIRTLMEHLKIKKEKSITDIMKQASLKLYKKEWSIKDGVTSRMLLYFCKEKNISCLGFDQKDKLFLKHSRDENKARNYNSIIYYYAVGHFYLVSDPETVRHLSQSFKDNKIVSSSILTDESKKNESKYIGFYEVFNELYQDLDVEEDEEGNFIEQKRDYEREFNIIEKLDKNTTILFSQGHLNMELKAYIQRYNDAPKVKYSSLSNVKEIKTYNGVVLTLTECIIDSITIKSICEKQNFEYKNQTIGTLLMELLDKHFQTKRIKFTNNERTKIVESQNNECKLCGDKLNKKFQIDHIRPISNGGTNQIDNLQALCISCHQEKTKEEHNDCEHFEIKDYVSNYNIEAYNTIKSKFFTKVQFSEYLLNEQQIKKLKEKYNLYSIDGNRFRRNLLINYFYNFCVFSSLDNIEVFDGKITDGFYYIETDNVFPLRKNGFYSRPIVEFCLKKYIITFENIRYQYKASLSIKSDYFKPFINYLMKVFDNKDLQKLSVNSLIGMFGRRDNSFVQNDICLKENLEDIYNVYNATKRPYMIDLTDEYCAITSKINIDTLESAYPIYAQILDCEAIELYKMVELVRENNGIPICIKTDAVVYFANEPINIENYFWDEDKTILKYKYEEPCLLKKSIKWFNNEKYKIQSKVYNVIEDTKDFNYNIEVAKQIVESGKGWFLDGLAGVGKTKLVNEIVRLINDDTTIKRLTPTNVSAILINGQTIDKFAYTYLNNSKAIKKLSMIKYIFIDEVSMMKELFYSVFLSIKYLYPSIKFIISGDFNQLAPVNDRKYFKYESSRALYELVDGNKVKLTLCRRSDDRLYNLCYKILNNQPHDITELTNKPFTSYKNICYTNETRKLINEKCMKQFLKEQSPKMTFNIIKLSYDNNTQDYTLCKGMPLISRVNMKSLEIVNNETFVCSKINSDTIEVENEYKTIEIPKDKFNKIFLLAFCITTHKSQGLSLNEKYCIHEYEKFDKKLAYVALSRATKYEKINIIINESELNCLNYCGYIPYL